jgi:hypothetical protein
MMVFGKSELYYTEPVAAAEANAVGKLLMQTGFFRDDREAAVHIAQEDGAFQLKFVIDPSRAADPTVKKAFIDLSRNVAVEALGERPVFLHLCDGNFATLYSERL